MAIICVALPLPRTVSVLKFALAWIVVLPLITAIVLAVRFVDVILKLLPEIRTFADGVSLILFD